MPTGTISTYDLTVGVKVRMDEAIYLYSPEDLPMLTGQGSDGLSLIGTEDCEQVEESWLDEENLAPRSTLNGALTTGTTLVTLASGGRLRFSTGDLITIRSAGSTELVYVDGYSATTAEQLLVTRAFGALDTATDHADGSDVIGVGTALAEGATPQDARQVDTAKRTNNTQIFGPTKLEITGTGLVVPRYGKPNEWTHQLHHRTYENGQAREQAYLYGKTYNSTTTKIRTTGGLRQFITTNVDATSTQLNETSLNSNMQSCYDYGGVPDRVMANPHSLSDLNALTDTNRVRVDYMDSRRGRVRVAVFDGEYGSITIARNRWLDRRDAVGFTREGVTRKVLRPFMMEMLAKTGDSQSAQILCEEMLKVKGQKHMFWMNALVYS